MKTFEVTKGDIVNVATSIHVVLTEKEIEWALLCYEDAQRQDPTGSWNLVVEDLVYQAVNFRKETGSFDQLGYEQTHPEPGDDDYEGDIPPINNFHTDGDGDDNTLLNFIG